MLAMMSEDRPTTAESYISATTSSNLKLGERKGSIDLIAAAGMLRKTDGSLGAMLLRLMGEYDSVRGPARAARKRLIEGEAAARLEAGSQKFGPTQAARMQNEAASRALMDRYETLSQLKTLVAAREAFGVYACREAQRRSIISISDRRAQEIAGKVLHALMEPGCAHCDGRGFNGSLIRGEIERPCKPCHGSGRTSDEIGSTDEERSFAEYLHARAESKINEAASGIAKSARG